MVNLRVTKTMMINFNIGKYCNEVWCSILQMQLDNMIKSADHDGRTNNYFVVKDGEKFILQPLTPKQVRED